MSRETILIVEDEAITGMGLKKSLSDLGYVVIGIVPTGEQAIEVAVEQKPNIVLMDIQLAGKMDGITAAENIRIRTRIPVIYLTKHSDHRFVQKAKITEPFGYIIKPVSEAELKTTIEIALYKAGIEQKLKVRDDTIRRLLNAVTDDLVLINSERKIIAINDSMAKKLGQKTEILIGKAILDFLTSSVLSDTLDQIINSPLMGKSTYFEEKLDNRWIETLVYPVSDISETEIGIVIQSHDITQRKHLEEELKREGISQIGQNMLKFQILNDQIRNPLQVIKGYLSLDNTKYSDAINEQVGIINSLVTQLDIGWVESEKVQMFFQKHPHTGNKSLLKKQQEDDLQ